MLPVVLTFAVLLVVGVIAGAVVYVKRENARQHREAFATFRSIVVQHLQKHGPKSLRFDSLVAEYEIPVVPKTPSYISVFHLKLCQ